MEKKLRNREIITVLESYINDRKTQLENLEYNVLEKTILSKLEELKEEVPEVYYDFFENRSIKYRQEVIYSFLDKEYDIEYAEEESYEDYVRKYSDRRNKVFKFISKKTRAVRDLIADKDQREFGEKIDKFKESVIDKDYSNCLKKCNIDKSDMNELKNIERLLARDRSEEDVYKNKQNIQMIKKTECLLNCHLDYLTSVFAEVSLAYDNCLKKSGYKTNNFNDGVADVFSSVPELSDCSPFHEQLVSLHKKIIETLDVVYPKESSREFIKEREMWIKILNEKVSNADKGQHLKQNIPMVQKTFKNKFQDI